MNLIKKILGFIPENRKSHDITLEDMKNMLKISNDIILLDVRNPQEYKEGHIEGAINIPIYELLLNIKCKVPNKKATIITYCKSGIRSKKAVEILKKCGYQNLYNVNAEIYFN